MVKWANDDFFQANASKMLVNDGEMNVWLYTHFTIIAEHFTIINEHFIIIDEHFTIINSILRALACSKPSYAHLTIIEKLHRLPGVSVLILTKVSLKLSKLSWLLDNVSLSNILI